MANVKSHNMGSVTIEYVLVMLLLMIPIWYGLMGGSGSWTNTPSNKGNLTKPAAAPPSGSTFTGLVESLNDRETKFAAQINAP